VASAAAVALMPGGEDGSTSGLKLLSMLPTGLAGACVRPAPRSASYEVEVNGIYLCGVCHVETASALAAASAVKRHGRHATVALECDEQTLRLLNVASRAIEGMSKKCIRADGIEHVRQALFDSEYVKELGRARGKQLASPSHVGLQPAIERHLRADGVLWSGEMATAAAAASEVGARVVCLKPSTGSWAEVNGASASNNAGDGLGALAVMTRNMLGLAAFWLRAHELHPGFDERSCEAAGVAAANTALAEALPREYVMFVDTPDDHMAQRLCRLRDERPRTSSPSVVAIVGAQHVPGLRRRLKNASGIESAP